MLRQSIALAFLLVAAVPVAGDDLLAGGGDFDAAADYAGWQVFDAASDQWSSGSDLDGCPESGAATGVTGPFGEVTRASVFSPCVPLDGLTQLTVDFEFLMNGTAQVNLVGYADPSCATFVAATGGVEVNGLLSSHYRDRLIAFGSYVQLAVFFESEDGHAQVWVLDRVQLSGDEPLFSDDFEGGSGCRWSLSGTR